MADAAEAALDLPLAAAAALIREGALTSRALTEAAIRRARAVQPATNAFVAILADRARADAEARDAERRAGRIRGPLHGIPLAHKDCLERAGEPMRVGSAVTDATPGARDATVLARLAAAGAVDLGRLHLNEMVAGPTGQNPTLGDCRNAWDTARVSGGSSSGSAVAVATGAAFGAMASDTGGSTRLPAAMNGLFGVKPTYGRVSRAGVFPRAFSLDCVGPIARTAEDCAILLDAIAGRDPADPGTLDAPVPDTAARLATAADGSRLAVLADERAQHPDIADAFATLRAAAAEAFGPVPERRFPLLGACYALGDVISKVEAATLHGTWLAERGALYSQAVFSRTEPGLHIPATRYLEALLLRARVLERFLSETMEGVDVLLCPTLPVPVPTRAEADMEAGGRVFSVVPELTRLTRPFSYLGLPVVTMPAGLDRNGMPIGVQLIGRPLGEARLLSLADRLARRIGWSFAPSRTAAVRTITPTAEDTRR
jgi:aspartyl-tRNA(Asn)/glutamyl-tRNA(Gln) amidotransferase subunit A